MRPASGIRHRQYLLARALRRPCLVDRLNAFIAELSAPATPQAERIVALKYVLHFVGDIHKPLHASDHEDHGGNCVRLAGEGARTTNLHSYWDTGRIVTMGTDPVALASQLQAKIASAQVADWSAPGTRPRGL